jgi:hypothetical protein
MRKTSNGKKVRSFTITDAAHIDGCPTKFSNKDYTGEFTSSTYPSRAASKAVSKLCRVKRVKGQCTLYVKIRETTRESKKKEFSYKVKRVKKDQKEVKASPYGNEYVNVIKSINHIPKEDCPKSHKSSGRKSKKTMLARRRKH